MRCREFYAAWVSRAFGGTFRKAEYASGLAGIVALLAAAYVPGAADLSMVPAYIFGSVFLVTVAAGLIYAPWSIYSEVHTRHTALLKKVTPSFSLSFAPQDPFVRLVEARLFDTDERIPAIYVRVQVSPHSAVVPRCRAELVNVERLSSAGEYEKTAFADAIRLCWAAQPTRAAALGDLDIRPEGRHFVDVISTNQRSRRLHIEGEPQLHVLEDLFEPGTYRLTVAVASGDQPAETIRLKVEWNSVWEDLNVQAA